MDQKAFEQLVEEEFPNAVPEKFHHLIKNVAFLVEREPSQEVRREERLASNETLLGLYHGIPATARGDLYGMGGMLPDTIILFQHPIEKEAAFLCKGDVSKLEGEVRVVIRETIWHEVAHHFGYDENQVRKKEHERGDMIE